MSKGSPARDYVRIREDMDRIYLDMRRNALRRMMDRIRPRGVESVSMTFLSARGLAHRAGR